MTSQFSSKFELFDEMQRKLSACAARRRWRRNEQFAFVDVSQTDQQVIDEASAWIINCNYQVDTHKLHNGKVVLVVWWDESAPKPSTRRISRGR